ncbi:unnamed protein product, partial [Phaeothamnion confervicola]
SKQLFLDFGQRSFGKPVHCHRCGLLFVKGIEQEEAEHSKFCRRAIATTGSGIPFTGWKTERIVWRLPPNSATAGTSAAAAAATAAPAAALAPPSGPTPSADERIVEVRADDPPSHKAKLQDVIAAADADMGFARAAPAEEERRWRRRRAFLYVRDKHVMGCVVAEPVETAF